MSSRLSLIESPHCHTDCIVVKRLQISYTGPRRQDTVRVWYEDRNITVECLGNIACRLIEVLFQRSSGHEIMTELVNRRDKSFSLSSPRFLSQDGIFKQACYDTNNDEDKKCRCVLLQITDRKREIRWYKKEIKNDNSGH